jgi:crotonobetainyl-CoA:carnitine CoA-transferase CaiB-like acyl-CoA transferase
MLQGALAGITVVEFCEFIAGPYCSKLLADMGAEVIKMEPPGRGDIARSRPPFKGDRPNEGSGLFFFLNTNKQSITLDPANPAGRRDFLDLIKGADLLVEDRSPGWMEAVGLDYKSLSRHNPKLVVTSITPFGQTGPYRNYRAYPLNTFHSGGEGYLTPGGTPYPQRPPLKWAKFSGDYFCGISAAGAALLALFHQRATGRGQHVDVSKQEALLDLNTTDILRWPNRGLLANRATRGYRFAGIMPCKDGYIDFCFNQWPKEWLALLEVIGIPDWWGDDEKLQDRIYCEERGDELKQRLASSFKSRAKENLYWEAIAKRAALAPCFGIDEIANSAQMEARGFFVPVDHPRWGKFRFPSAPYRFSETPWTLRRLAPLLGEHNNDIHRQRLDRSLEGISETKGPSTAKKTKPLSGIRVVDLSWGMAGPLTTCLLAAAGAEVIKVESVQRPDMTRSHDDPVTGKRYGLNESPLFNDLSRGKLGATFNLKHPRGLELIKALIKISDVLVENYSAGVMDRMGLGYEVVKELNPAIVMSSSSTMGSIGPEVRAIGYAPLFAASSGLSDMTGYPDGPPTEIRYSMDILSGYTSFMAIMMALVCRQRTGMGQHIDLSSRESISILLADALMDYALNGRVSTRCGNEDDVMAPHNCYRCRGEDNWVSIAIGNDEEWLALSNAMGRPAWAGESRFATAPGRKEHELELDRLVESWTVNFTHYQVMEILQAAGVAAVPSFTPQDLFTDPHLEERQAYMVMKHPEAGERFSIASPPWKLSETPCLLERDAPLLGEHTELVCRQVLGLSAEETKELREDGALD